MFNSCMSRMPCHRIPWNSTKDLVLHSENIQGYVCASLLFIKHPQSYAHIQGRHKAHTFSVTHTCALFCVLQMLGRSLAYLLYDRSWTDLSHQASFWETLSGYKYCKMVTHISTPKRLPKYKMAMLSTHILSLTMFSLAAPELQTLWLDLGIFTPLYWI